MLTFFDYLRQRAFESVLAGAQEALEALEREKNRAESKTLESKIATPRLASHAEPSLKQPESNAPGKNASATDDDLLPPPRRRGRPERFPKGKQ